MKQCPFCGMNLDDSARFCCRCGRALEETQQAPAAVQTMPPAAAAEPVSAPHEYEPPVFEPHPFEEHPFEAHPYEPTDYSSIHVYGANEDPSPQYYAPVYDGGTAYPPGQEKRRVWPVVRAILGGIGTAFLLLLCLSARSSGDTVSAILLLVAAALLLPVVPLDRLRRQIVPKTWLRGLIIAALIITAALIGDDSESGSGSGSDPAAPQTAVTETVKQENETDTESGFAGISAQKSDIQKN